MTTYIHMGRILRDIEIDREDDGLIRIEQDKQSVRLTPEGARSLAFMLIGMTDAMGLRDEPS